MYLEPDNIARTLSYPAFDAQMICCPLTNQVKGYPFEVPVEVFGVALADQIKSLDWRARNAKKKARAPKRVFAEVIAKTNALLRLEH